MRGGEGHELVLSNPLPKFPEAERHDADDAEEHNTGSEAARGEISLQVHCQPPLFPVPCHHPIKSVGSSSIPVLPP